MEGAVRHDGQNSKVELWTTIPFRHRSENKMVNTKKNNNKNKNEKKIKNKNENKN